jgi:molecular chaperone GrpE (heat shock protein)
LAAIALAAWRTAKRSQRSGDPAVVLPSVQFAATRLLEALETAGVQFLEYVGDSFDENLRVNVVEVKGSGARKRIVECLEPGVVVGGDLVHMASVVVAAQEER